ncbi:hypothetical protein [Streptomyces goshikiensis]|uniref:hypothetical protein n=1 Tax=Streptomyces goshikiensis TaxID=1942 RepID=UPI0036BC3EC5
MCEQDRRLIEAQPAIPAPSTQVSHPGHVYAPEHAHPAPQPGFLNEPVPAGTEGTEEGPAPWQDPPPVPPSLWVVEEGYGQGTFDDSTYGEAFRYFEAAAQIAQIARLGLAQPGYQDTCPDPYLDVWAADAPHDTCVYHEGWTAGPPGAPADEEALQRTSCIRRSYAAPLHRTGLILPDAAFLLLTLLVTALMCAAAVAFSKIANAAGNLR